MTKRTAVVTGANRGIGKEISRQLSASGFRVIMTGRDLSQIQGAAGEVGNLSIPFQLDVTDEASVKLFVNFMTENYPQLDVLINNAGIIGNDGMREFNLDQIEHVMATNFYGPLRLTKHMMPLIKKSSDPRVINLSSQMGAWDALKGGGYAAYRISKVTLNAFTLLLSAEIPDLKIFSMDPGWVKTGMGGSNAPRSVEKGAETVTWLATADEARSGNFYRDKKIIPW